MKNFQLCLLFILVTLGVQAQVSPLSKCVQPEINFDPQALARKNAGITSMHTYFRRTSSEPKQLIEKNLVDSSSGRSIQMERYHRGFKHETKTFSYSPEGLLITEETFDDQQMMTQRCTYRYNGSGLLMLSIRTQDKQVSTESYRYQRGTNIPEGIDFESSSNYKSATIQLLSDSSIAVQYRRLNDVIDTYQFTYDKQGALVKKTLDKDNVPIFSHLYFYNQDGRLESEQTKYINEKTLRIDHKYNAQGLLIETIVSDGAVFNYEYSTKP